MRLDISIDALLETGIDETVAKESVPARRTPVTGRAPENLLKIVGGQIGLERGSKTREAGDKRGGE